MVANLLLYIRENSKPQELKNKGKERKEEWMNEGEKQMSVSWALPLFIINDNEGFSLYALSLDLDLSPPHDMT